MRWTTQIQSLHLGLGRRLGHPLATTWPSTTHPKPPPVPPTALAGSPKKTAPLARRSRRLPTWRPTSAPGRIAPTSTRSCHEPSASPRGVVQVPRKTLRGEMDEKTWKDWRMVRNGSSDHEESCTKTFQILPALSGARAQSKYLTSGHLRVRNCQTESQTHVKPIQAKPAPCSRTSKVRTLFGECSKRKSKKRRTPNW